MPFPQMFGTSLGPSVDGKDCFSFSMSSDYHLEFQEPLDPSIWLGLPWLGLCPASLPAPVLLCRKAAKPRVWDKRDRGHGENPALTFIEETRWVSPGSGCQPCGQARLETHTLACHCPELQPQPQDPTCSHHRCRWEGALGDWTLLLIH